MVKLWHRLSPSSGSFFALGFQFNMAAEFLPHGAENSFGKGMLLSRTEASIKCSRENVRRYSFFQRRHDGPAPFARILNKTCIFGKRRILSQGHSGQVQKPR